MNFVVDNIGTILTIASIVVPYLLPAKYASKWGIVLKIFKKVGDFAHKVETSKGGLSLKPEFEEKVKDEAIESISKVIAAKTERFEQADVKNIIQIAAKSKGVKSIKNKLENFTREL